MCQAYEGERNSIIRGEFLERCERYTMDGRIARQEGRPRDDWEKLVVQVRHDIPDGEFYTPSYWMAHWFDGPNVKGWLEGWDDEDRRIAAGGTPLDREERERIVKSIRHLDITRMMIEENRSGTRSSLSHRHLSDLFALTGEEPPDNFTPSGTWSFDARVYLDMISTRMDGLKGTLYPHSMPKRAEAEAVQ
jgi:hypothetical protein